MTFSKMMISYVLTTLVFFMIDILWLGLIAKNIYRKYLGALMSETVNWAAAFIFYLLFIAGIFIFVIVPSLEKQSPGRAIVLGALFGLITYATYDLTNYATLKGFPINVVVIDLIWGTFLTTVVSISGYFITKYFVA
ncbi:MAG: DUF2177 family protein [Prolixibacteraceae bacterium]